MTVFERITALIMLVSAGIWAGVIVMYAVERVNLWARMPIDQFVVDFRRSVFRADPMQPILAVVSFLGAVLFAFLAGGRASVFAWIGAALIGFVIVLSIALPERINGQFRRRAEGVAPPDVESLRTSWRRLHLIRTPPTVAALIFVVLASTFV